MPHSTDPMTSSPDVLMLKSPEACWSGDFALGRDRRFALYQMTLAALKPMYGPESGLTRSTSTRRRLLTTSSLVRSLRHRAEDRVSGFTTSFTPTA